MKRSMLIIALAAILFAAAGGSIAYFTTSATATNIITAGNVRMTLHDETADGEVFPQDGLSTLMPGDTADKIVYVENSGENAFYARIKLRCSAQSPDGSALSFDKIALNIDKANWQLGADGWYYYSSAVEKGAKTGPLFTEVTLLSDTGNAYMDANVRIEVIAQAVQKANNGATVWQAAGWPLE